MNLIRFIKELYELIMAITIFNEAFMDGSSFMNFKATLCECGHSTHE